MRNVEEIKRQVENSLLKKPNENYLIEKCLFCKDKLYKYYSFEGYAFQNLKDGILYCSSPKIFNDPFDCGLNFDLNQILLDVIPILCKARKMSDIQIDLLMSLLDSIDIIKLLPKEVTKEFFQNSIPMNLDKNLNEMLTKIFNLIYESDDLLEFFVNLSKTIGGPIIDINTVIKEKNLALDKGKDLINESLRIFCLTERPDNILMWSHYSNKHTGFCVEYDILQNLDVVSKVFPVIYSEERPSITMDFFDLSDSNQIKISNSKKSNLQLILFFLTKCKIWEYEQEWRYITFSDLTENNKVKAPPVSKIYLGANIEEENKKLVLEYAKINNIEVKQMKINRDKFLLESTNI